MSSRARILGLLVLTLVVASVTAHVRLRHSTNGNALEWSASSIDVVISARGSDDISDATHFSALRNAIDAWAQIPDTAITLVEDDDPAEQAREDWESNGIHLLVFDEDNESGFFPNGSGIVALTPIWFTSGGNITDADVLFNGRGFRFTTSGVSGRFDVADVATHELGHLLGLDHSGFAGSSMYPYVDPRVILHRSVSSDDILGLRNAYPAGTYGEFTGTVQDGTDPVPGAHVVARDSAGRPACGVLTEADGTFVMRGLPDGTYSLYATPFDDPVSASNIGAFWTVDTEFESTVFGDFVISGAASVDVSTLQVDPDVGVSLGRSTDDYPLRVVRGATTALSVRGLGLDPGGTLSCADPDVTISVTALLGTLVQFSATVSASEELGHLDLVYENASGEQSILVGGLEVTPADPSVSVASPASADAVGGTPITISGSGFRAGSRVVVGDRVYVEGAPDGCTLVNSNTITLTLAPTIPGQHHVTVIDESGVEGRLIDGFRATAIPAVTSIFPTVGSSDGGTEITIAGSDFVPDSIVRIDGVLQGSVSYVSATVLRVTTEAGPVGGPYLLEIENPGGGLTTIAFSYVSQPDPRVNSCFPTSGPKAGGTVVTVVGENFGPDTEVRFGSDPVTGEGGKLASAIELVDTSTMLVTTPESPSGVAALSVHEPATGQSHLLGGAFTFEGSSSSSSDGGGCLAVRPGVPVDPSGGAWLPVLGLLALALYRKQAGRPQPQAASTRD